MGETYAELGGQGETGAYAGRLYVDCSNCQAPAGIRCVNPITGAQRSVPCVDRGKNASTGASSE